MALSLALALLTLPLAAPLAPPLTAAPSVLWVSTPVLPGDTVMVAGAGLQGAKVQIAGAGPSCAAAAMAASGLAAAWAQSVKVLLPAGCGPPCNITIETAAPQPVVVTVNAPHVAWGLHGSKVAPGGTLRLFGRGLAWEHSHTADGSARWRCIDGRSRQAAPSTKLRIATSSGAPPVLIEAGESNCYEVTFAMPPGLRAGRHSAELVTAWGATTITLEIVEPVARRVVHFSVDSDFGGHVNASLRAAANATTEPGVNFAFKTRIFVLKTRNSQVCPLSCTWALARIDCRSR